MKYNPARRASAGTYLSRAPAAGGARFAARPAAIGQIGGVALEFLGVRRRETLRGSDAVARSVCAAFLLLG